MSAEQIHRLLELAGQPIPRPAPVAPTVQQPLVVEVEPAEPRDWRHHPAEPQPADPRAFGQLPMAVIRDLELSAGAVRLFAELAAHGWRERSHVLGRPAGVVRGVTAAQLAANIGVTRRAVLYQLGQLEQRRHAWRDPTPGQLVVFLFGLQL